MLSALSSSSAAFDSVCLHRHSPASNMLVDESGREFLDAGLNGGVVLSLSVLCPPRFPSLR